MLFLCTITFTYLRILEKATCAPWKLSLYESKMIKENLEKEQVRKSAIVRSMNIIFRLKIIYLLACIVMLQNQTHACLILMLLAQVAFFGIHFRIRAKFGKIFDGWISFLNCYIIEVTITLLLTICIVLFWNQPKDTLSDGGKAEEEVSTLESVANLVLVILVISSILIEILNVILDIYGSIK